MEVRVFSFLTMLCVGLYGESTRAECAKSKVNLVFLFDGSASMTTEDFQKNKRFIWDIVTTLRNSSIKFAAVQFSWKFRTVFTFEDYANGAAKDKLDKEEHMKQLTSTHNAIQFTLDNLFDNVKSGADPEATKALVIITDGAPSDKPSGVIKRCDDLDIIRFVIGVGNIDLKQLNNLASEPKNNNTFKIENYDELNGLLKQLQINIYGIEGKPDSVTLHSVPDVWVEGDQTELLCEIINVGRGRALSVRWSRADPEQNSNFTQFNETFFPELEYETKTVNKRARLKVTPRREDDGAQYRCDAVLNLSQHGSQVFASQPIPITVRSN